MNFEPELQESIRYLSSDEAMQSLAADAYWPKWNSPWWHMLLLHEMGHTNKIPRQLIGKYVEALNRIPLKIFPIFPAEMHDGIDPYRGSPCHCQLGNVYQVLAKWGVNVDVELPWIRPWFLEYQMSDGGLNCDNSAYLAQGEVPSSMVGTIAAFEAVLLYTSRPWTEKEKYFLERGAQFLMGRKLMHGSSTNHNAAERISAEKWTNLCFPRFYLYDVLRGLNALVLWGEKTKNKIPLSAVQDVASLLESKFSDGNVRIERKSYEGTGTIVQNGNGEWMRGQPATYFPLLTKVSGIGELSPFLSQQLTEIRKKISAQNLII